MNEYKKQADDFLLNNNLSLSIQKAVPQKQPEWTKYTGQEHGINYWCILKNIDTKKEYAFNFWDSIKNKYENKKPSKYDVLTCLDVYEYIDFNDFCDTFGYNNDSISAKNTYNLVLEQTAGLKRTLNNKQIKELNEIN